MAYEYSIYVSYIQRQTAHRILFIYEPMFKYLHRNIKEMSTKMLEIQCGKKKNILTLVLQTGGDSW